MDIMTAGIQIDDSWTTKNERSTSNPSILANIITHDVAFAKDAVENLYYYHEGVYKANGEGAIRELYKKVLDKWDKPEEWKPRKANDIIEYISLTSRYLWTKPPLYQINLLNGIYDLQEEVLKPHTPDWLSTTRIPIMYDIEATCPYWDEFLESVLPVNGGVNYLVEIIGLCMVPFTGLQKCIILVGKGSNGKSKYLWGLQQAVGLDNVCNISLHTLTNPMEKFSRAGLVGKLVNVFGDLSQKKIEDAASFKALTGEDRMQIEYKHKKPFWYTPYAKLIFSCNNVMTSDDESEGYKRRFVQVPFIKQFKVDPEKGLEIEENLSKPTELSGLFNKIKTRLADVIERGYTVTNEIASIIDEWCPIPDTTKAWLEQEIEVADKGAIPMAAFYDYYAQNCPFSETLERIKLIGYVKGVFPMCMANRNIKYKDHTFKGYLGITLKNKEILKELVEKSILNKMEY